MQSSSALRPTGRSRKRLRRVINFAVIAAAIIVVVLVVLIAGGVLVLPGSSPAPVTITSVEIHVEQGNTSSGSPWFGTGSLNTTYTIGYPAQIKAGSTFDVPTSLVNYDSHNHSLQTVQIHSRPSANSQFVSSSPALPVNIPVGFETQDFTVYISAPSTPGVSYVLVVVISAITPG